jgi:hypothetical protein
MKTSSLAHRLLRARTHGCDPSAPCPTVNSSGEREGGHGEDKNPMSMLYRRLSEAGVQAGVRPDVILPEWWSDALALGPTAFDQALGYVARSLGYKPADLRRDVTLALPPPVVKYKLRQGVSDGAVATSASIALRAALLAARALAANVT